MPGEPAPGGTPGQNQALRLKRKFIAAERQQESGGDYQIVNSNSGALGAWQVMPANLPGWLRASKLPPMTPYQYLHNDKAQNRLAWVILGGYYDKYGAAGAAAEWYSGQPDPNKTYGHPPVYQYVHDVLALMGGKLPPLPTAGIAVGIAAFGLPPPGEGDWSDTLRSASLSHARAAGSLAGYARQITRLR